MTRVPMGVMLFTRSLLKDPDMIPLGAQDGNCSVKHARRHDLRLCWRIFVRGTQQDRIRRFLPESASQGLFAGWLRADCWLNAQSARSPIPEWDFHSAASPDRKSTRLNSSHLVISYAV